MRFHYCKFCGLYTNYINDICRICADKIKKDYISKVEIKRKLQDIIIEWEKGTLINTNDIEYEDFTTWWEGITTIEENIIYDYLIQQVMDRIYDIKEEIE